MFVDGSVNCLRTGAPEHTLKMEAETVPQARATSDLFCVFLVQERQMLRLNMDPPQNLLSHII